MCQRPLTRLLLSHHLRSSPHPQSLQQQHRSQGRLRARCRPQGDDDNPSRVRCCPRVFASVHCQRPLTLPPHLCSLEGNQLCGLDYKGKGTYTAEGITKLCEGLKGSSVTSLKCAAPRPERLLSCQRPLTRVLSHPSHPVPRLQYWGQRHRRRGRLRSRCRPQGDANPTLGVRRRPRAFAFVSMPVDTRLLSHCPHPHPSLAVSEATTSEPRAPLRSPPSLRRRRSPTWGAPPPECLLLCQCPLTHLQTLPPFLARCYLRQ